MSIAALADDEILRTSRNTLRLEPVVEARLDHIIAAAAAPGDQRANVRAAVQPVAAENPIQKTPPSNALDGLVKYIPTETITLYVAATAAITQLTAAFPSVTAGRLYWAFVVLTPILFVLIYLGKRRSQKLPLFPDGPWWKNWPWWKLCACTVAFMVWALAVPPLVETEGGKVVAAFGALLVSTILSLVGAVVEPPES
jgi:hypothetical protein